MNFFSFRIILFSFFCTAGITKSSCQLENYTKVGEKPTLKDNFTVQDFSQVDLLTGNPSISMPLYTIKMNDFELPIILTYNINSIKVPNSSSWVGFGWNLNVGGEITRTVCGTADDVMKNSSAYYPRIPTKNIGWLTGGAERANDFNLNYANHWRNAYEVLKTMGTPCHFNDNKQPILYTFQGVPCPYFDTEPDIFNLNLPQESSTFVFDRFGQAQHIKHSNSRISYELSYAQTETIYTQGITEFTVTDERGNKYLFADPEAQLLSSSYHYWSIDNIAPNDTYYSQMFRKYKYNNSWKPTLITTASGEMIQFYYEEEEVVVGNSHYKFKAEKSYSDGIGPTSNYSETSKLEKRLSRIETNGMTIKFISDLTREDILGAKALTWIEIYSKSADGEKLVKKIKLNYNYFESPPPGDELSIVAFPANSKFPVKNNFFKRLKLQSVYQYDKNTTVSLDYTFSYNETYALPNRMSYNKDFWGYFNNQNTASITRKGIPTIIMASSLNTTVDRLSVFDYDNVGTKNYFTSNNRNPSSSGEVASSFGLRKIIFPTGGSIEYDFEPHDFYIRGKNFIGGGLRLRTQKIYDNLSNKTVLKEYSYLDKIDINKSSGKIINYPVFAFTENTAGFRDQQGTLVRPQVECQSPSSLSYFKYATSVTSDPEWLLGIEENSSVQYEFVTEKISDGLIDNGVIMYNFNVKDAFQILNSSDVYAPLSNPLDYGYSVYQWDACNYWNCMFMGEEYNSMPDLRGLYFGKGSNNAALYSINSWDRGQLLSKETYSAMDQTNLRKLKEKDVYEYQHYPLNTTPQEIKALNFSYNENYHFGLVSQLNYSPDGIYNDKRGQFIIYSPYKYFISQDSKVSKKTILKRGDNGLDIKTEINYNYDPVTLFLKNETSTNSQGESITTTYFYPKDYSNVSPYSNMINKNIISPVIKESVSKNGSEFIKSSELIYANWNNSLFKPASKLEKVLGNAPWTKIEYLDYDNIGNLLSYKENGLITSFIYDEQKLEIIAKVQNAECKNIFYSSFEGSEGNVLSVPKTGQKSFSGTFVRNLAGLNNGEYVLSYWKNVSGNWTLSTNIVNVQNGTYTINLIGNIDEIRFYPANSQMQTFTYQPLVGVLTVNDQNNQISYFNYDDFGRLSNVRDQFGNISKVMEYKYQKKRIPNDRIFKTFTKNNCPSGQYGESFTYVIQPGEFYSDIDVNQANAQAINQINNNGQTITNNTVGCLTGNVVNLTNTSGINDLANMAVFIDGVKYYFPPSGIAGAFATTLSPGIHTFSFQCSQVYNYAIATTPFYCSNTPVKWNVNSGLTLSAGPLSTPPGITCNLSSDEDPLSAFCNLGSMYTTTVYTQANQPIQIGSVVYYDAALTQPIIGRSSIYPYSNNTDGIVFSVDPNTGVVLAKATKCPIPTSFSCNLSSDATPPVGMCGTGNQYTTTVYTSGGAITPGTQLFENMGLTQPVTGSTWVRSFNGNSQTIYQLSNTGIVLSNGSINCP